MTAKYDIGDRRKLSCTVLDEDDKLADPTDLTFSIRLPDKTITTYEYGTDNELVKDSVGEYYVYWDCTQSGAYFWRYAASGSIGAAEEATFTVQKSKVLGI